MIETFPQTLVIGAQMSLPLEKVYKLGQVLRTEKRGVLITDTYTRILSANILSLIKPP
jgi:hypothetical protein